MTTSLGMVLAFVPSRTIESVGLFELKMGIGISLFLLVASLLFAVNTSRKPRPSLSS